MKTVVGLVVIVALIWTIVVSCSSSDSNDPAQKLCDYWTEYGSHPNADHDLAWQNIKQYC